MSNAVLASIGFPIMLSAMLDGLDLVVHLYTNDPPLTVDLTRSQLTEVVYDDYEPIQLAKYSPPVVTDEDARTFFDAIMFQYKGGPVPLPVRGYFVTSTRDGELLWAWRRPDAPFQFTPEKDRLIVSVGALFPGCP